MWMCINHLTCSLYELVVILSVSFRGTCGACGPSPSTPSPAAPASWRYDAAPTSTSSHRPSVPAHQRWSEREVGRDELHSSSHHPSFLLSSSSQWMSSCTRTSLPDRFMHSSRLHSYSLSLFFLYLLFFLSSISPLSHHLSLSCFYPIIPKPHFTGSLVIWT